MVEVEVETEVETEVQAEVETEEKEKKRKNSKVKVKIEKVKTWREDGVAEQGGEKDAEESLKGEAKKEDKKEIFSYAIDEFYDFWHKKKNLIPT